MIRRMQKECESSCEYILPDYLGDVKKVVLTTAKAQPSGQFESDGELECAGIVTYDVVYLDSENKLSCASFSSDYDFSLKKPSENYTDAYTMTELSNFAIRLTGPRRMIAKSNVTSEICVIEKWNHEERGNAFSESETLEKITRELNVESGVKSEITEREYAEEVASIEGVSADEIEVITSSAYVRISESIPVKDGVNVKGELIVTALIRTPDSSVFAIRREIPFDETVSISTDGENLSAIADVKVTSLNISANDGEGGSSLVANAIAEFSALTLFNEAVTVISDAYLKNCDTVSEYENVKVQSLVACETKSDSINVKIPLKELGIENVKEIFALNQDFRSLGLKREGNAVYFTGEIAFSGVACEILEDGEPHIIGLKFEHPVEINVNNNCQNSDSSRVFAKISPAGCEWEIEGECLNVLVRYNLSYSISEEDNVRCLASCEIVENTEFKKKASRVSVYYPDENETLFEIAKKFHTSVQDIARDNMITEATSLGMPVKSGYKKLIIR